MLHYFDLGIGFGVATVIGAGFFGFQVWQNRRNGQDVLHAIADAYMGTKIIETLDYAGDLFEVFDAIRTFAPAVFAQTRLDDVVLAAVRQFDADVDRVKARKIMDDLLKLDDPSVLREKMLAGFDEWIQEKAIAAIDAIASENSLG